MYVTLSPCYDCAKLIIQSGIKRIVFSEFYRNTTSLDLLNQAGIEIIYIKL
jgi:dCMP deaminase